MRNGFSMMMALAVIVMMASIAALVFSMSGKTVKQTTAQYRYEQAALLAKSYTEAAMLTVQSRMVWGCPKTLMGRVSTTEIGGATTSGAYTGDGYFVVTRIKYIGLKSWAARICGTMNRIATGSNDVSVMIDVDVRYRDPDARADHYWQKPWVHYRRRTLQRL